MKRLSVDGQVSVDSLGRSAFARHVLHTLTHIDATHGAVVGLEGEWGSGKTWVFNQLDVLAQELEDQDRPVLLRFNPWMVSGTHDLVAAFLGQLARQLDENSSKKGKPGQTARALVGAIDKYAGALSAIKHLAPALNLVIPGAGLAVQAVAAAAGQAKEVASAALPTLQGKAVGPSLIALRKDIESALTRYPHRIVVLIDDLDRIAPAEVAALVQTVKAVADFPNVVYLMAYAPATVAHALERSLDVENGCAYLEKIVQLPLALPEVPARRFQPFAIDRLRAALPASGIDSRESTDLDKALPLAAALMQTPRDVARLHTQLQIAAGALLGEVNLADVVVAEAVKLKVPGFMPWMRLNHAHVLAAGIARYDSTLDSRGFHYCDLETTLNTEQERDDQREALLAELRALAGAGTLARAPYERALEFVFDDLRRFTSANDKRSNWCRLQRFRFWYRWQCLCDYQEPLTVQQVQAIVCDPSSSDAQQWLNAQDSFFTLCEQICDLAGADITESDSVGWAEALLQAERRFGFDVFANNELGYGPFAALLALLRIDDTVRRDVAFRRIVTHASLAMAGRLVLDAVDEHDEARGRARVVSDRQLMADRSALSEVASLWIQRVEASLIKGTWLKEREQLSPHVCLNWMRLAGRPAAELLTLATRLLNDDPARLAPFFADLLDSPVVEQFGPRIAWDALPQAVSLHTLAQGSESFLASHRRLAEVIAHKAQENGP